MGLANLFGYGSTCGAADWFNERLRHNQSLERDESSTKGADSGAAIRATLISGVLRSGTGQE
ncbi:hypothetical protein [Pseudoprimorskyibacter insulae]|uniref:hypothetical protein n=1 Tax=Pseudoprimorskyibacter insulae TaxID=1695997 RepID=UPI000D55E279|nr:hypothetical protein [Pseudoprimorskyibacter insulae]